MSKIGINDKFTTKLQDETFLHITDNSKIGVAIIQRGYLHYFNQKFTEIFGYTKEDILKWRKREFYKIVHPIDLPTLTKNFNVENDNKTVSVRFRAITKDKEVIDIENYICHIYYNNKTAYLSSYFPIKKIYEEDDTSQAIKVKEKKKILLDFNPMIVKLLEDNDVEYKIYNIRSYREKF